MLNLVCALKCEALPLIDYYRLKRDLSIGVYEVFCNVDSNINLILSRPGKMNAAAATASLYHYSRLKTTAWLNVGIAGHRSLTLGNPVLAHKVIDVATGQTWYPQILFEPQVSTSDLKTLDKASTEYEDVLFDMEAAGFYCTASRFSKHELIHCLKIISDNADNPVQKPSNEFFTSLVSDNIGIIDNIINRLVESASELDKLEQPPACYNSFLTKWHFTSYQQGRLKQLLHRWEVLRPETDPEHLVGDCQSGRDIILKLENLLDNTVINF